MSWHFNGDASEFSNWCDEFLVAVHETDYDAGESARDNADMFSLYEQHMSPERAAAEYLETYF